ncbi:cytochrome C oxidase subunit IV family protein [Dyella sp.]|uniref:cytochrome C oxidase subunit IV family protein n=1 Tax=Dyella sp. TaxID=1869338 RepID=UPI003F7DB69C
MSAPSPPTLRSQLGALGALLALLAATAGLAYLPLGGFNTVLALSISVAKALVVMLVFMRLRSASPVIRLAAAAGFLWLSLLFVITLADYLTRGTLAAPF